MNIFVNIPPTYSKIYIVSDINPYNTGSRKLEIYKDKVLIDTISVSTDTFAYTATNVAPSYILTLSPSDLSMDTYFDDGVYHFYLTNTPRTLVSEVFGAVYDRKLTCCMASYLASKDTKCSMEYSDELNLNHAFLQSAHYAILHGDVETANCLWESASCNCSTC